MTECMQTCQKFQKSRSPHLTDSTSVNNMMANIAEFAYQPGTTKYYDDLRYGEAMWISVTDVQEEGKWLDWYTNEVYRHGRQINSFTYKETSEGYKKQNVKDHKMGLQSLFSSK